MIASERLAQLGRRLGFDDEAARSASPGTNPEFRALARVCRDDLARHVDAQLGPFDALHLRALREVPRERFVRPGDEALSAEDMPLPLDDDGLSTISAPHAYLLSFRLLDLGPGDRLVELGSGSGYGAALAAYIVGDRGHVTTFEIDPLLHERARQLLAPLPNVTAILGDAVGGAHAWGEVDKVVCTFAVERVPDAWLRALPEGAALVAPVGARDRDQVLTRYARKAGAIVASAHGGVRYVKNRSRLGDG